MVTMNDVAAHAGVSVATVSHVITGRTPVREKTRQRVLQSIEELNYQVNLVARGLKTQKTFSIGLVLPDTTKLFFQNLITGVLNTASEANYRVYILSSNYNFETERQLIMQLKSNLVDGLIVDSCVPRENASKWIDEVCPPNSQGSSFPTVLLENTFDSKRVSSVTVDNSYSSMLSTQHLLDIGRRRILYLAGQLQLEHEYERFQGYRRSLIANGLTPDPDLERTTTYTSEAGYHAINDALKEGISFNAVEASSDQEAIGALKALAEAGLRVPEDVAVCGFDNLFPSTLVTPALTTINMPNYQMGAVATKQLLDLINDPETKPKQHILATELIVRASTVPNVVTAWNLQGW